MSSDRQRTRVKQYLRKLVTPDFETVLLIGILFAPIYALLIHWWWRLKSFLSR